MAEIYHKLTIETPSTKVKELITSVEGIKRQYMSKTTGDASKIGGEIEYGDKSMWYNKLEVTDLSNKKIVWKTVDVQGGMPGVEDWLKTEMSFELEEK